MKKNKLNFLVILVSAVLMLCNHYTIGNADNPSFSWSEPYNGLKLGVWTDNECVWMAIENVSDAPIIVYSHVMTYETHYDWFELRLYAKDAVINQLDGRYIKIQLTDDRDKSAPVIDTLLSGERLVHKIDLYDMFSREVNGFFDPEGEFQMVLAYENSPCVDCKGVYKKIWSGSLETLPVKVLFQKSEELQFHLKISNGAPVGWGIHYNALIIKEVNGESHPFGSEISFSLLSDKAELLIGSELILNLKRTNKVGDGSLIPCNCAFDSEDGIWEIGEIDVFVDQ